MWNKGLGKNQRRISLDKNFRQYPVIRKLIDARLPSEVPNPKPHRPKPVIHKQILDSAEGVTSSEDMYDNYDNEPSSQYGPSPNNPSSGQKLTIDDNNNITDSSNEQNYVDDINNIDDDSIYTLPTRNKKE